MIRIGGDHDGPIADSCPGQSVPIYVMPCSLPLAPPSGTCWSGGGEAISPQGANKGPTYLPTYLPTRCWTAILPIELASHLHPASLRIAQPVMDAQMDA